MNMQRSWWVHFVAVALAGVAPAGGGTAAPPRLYADPVHSSPVSALGGDLLLLAGEQLGAAEIVYYERTAGDADPGPPSSLPDTNGPDRGLGRIVGRGKTAQSVVAALPAALDSATAYRVRIRAADGQWSNPVLINDARPRWLSPAYAYASQPVPGIGRKVRIIGRNLGPAGDLRREVRLSGPQAAILVAVTEQNPATDRYALAVTLPRSLKAGLYDVDVRIGGSPWVRLSAQRLEVRADPVQEPVYPVTAAGCLPGVGSDHARCIGRVIATAARTGGRVVFAPGDWVLADPTDSSDGIIVPAGVSLSGSGSGVAVIHRSSEWGRRPAFVLAGHNRVSDLTFTDDTRYSSDGGTPYLQLGVAFDRAAHGASAGRRVEDVIIDRDVFDQTFAGIGDGGLPVRGLVVADNVFGSFAYGLNLEGNGFNFAEDFTIEDSIVRGNTFYAGSLFDRERALGPIASQLGAARRLDFSDNVVDGSSPRFLYRPESPERGFRAGLFFALRGNVESMLLSGNVLSCTGDRAGDGEAIALDNNHNTPAFARVAAVTTADALSVSTVEPLLRKNEYGALPAAYFRHYWVEIVGGHGLGQVRHVVGYDDSNDRRFTIDTPWDVIPDATSRILVSRLMTDVVVVGNRVDQRAPLCTKRNPTRPAGGAIALSANMSDSVVDSNVLFDTNGIDVTHEYTVEDPRLHRTAGAALQYFLTIRDNVIDHEYQWESDASWSGIQFGYAISPTAGVVPPVGGYAELVTGNTVIKADGLRGGAISYAPTWYEGPPGAPPFAFIEGALVFANRLSDVRGKPAGAAAGYRSAGLGPRRVGIFVADQLVDNLVLRGNRCTGVDVPLANKSRSTIVDCSDADRETCGCAAPGGSPTPDRAP